MILRLLHTLKAQRNPLLIMGDQALVSGVNFLMGILLVAHLGLSTFGNYVLMLMVVQFVSSLHQGILVAPLLSLYAKQAQKAHYLKQLFGQQLWFSLLTFGLVFLGVRIAQEFYMEWQFSHAPLVLALWTALFVFHDFLRRVHFTQEQPVRAVLMDIIAYGLQPLLIFGLSHFEMLTLPMLLWCLIALYAMAIATSLVFFPQAIALQIDWRIYKSNWRYARYLVGTALLQWFSGNYFLMIAGGVLGAAALGAIRVAQNVMGILHFLFQALENIISVKAARILAQEGKLNMLRYMRKMSFNSGALIVLLLTAIAVFRRPILATLFGEEILDYEFVLIWFAGMYLFVYLGTMFRFLVRTLERNQIIFISYIITTGFSLVAAFPLVEYYGIHGVLLGLLAAQVLSMLVFCYYLKNELKWMLQSYTSS